MGAVAGSLDLMAESVLPLSGDEFVARLRAAGRPTPDDVSITFDGRRLDSRQAVLVWWAEVEPLIEADRSAGRLADPDELRGA